MGRARNFLASDHGSIAAEFALVVPLMVALTVGSINLGAMMYANTSLHFATQDTARCASVKGATCATTALADAYAKAKYKGPTLTGIGFVLTAASAGNCGNSVVGTGTYTLMTGLGTISVPMSATACYPA